MGFIDRLANAWKIFKLSFSLLKRDKSLIVMPLLLLSFFIIFFIVFFFLATFYYKSTYSYLYSILFLLILYFIATFFAAAQSWMIYEALRGKETTAKSGFKRAFRNFSDIFYFVLAIVLISLLSSWLRQKGRIGETTGSIINYLGGIAGRLVLPAMIITERNFKESVMQLKDSIKAIPEIATYEIGIGSITTLIFFIGLFLSLGLGYNSFFVFVSFFLIWTSLTILVSVYVNNTYYTLLYLTLIEKKKIKGLNIKI